MSDARFEDGAEKPLRLKAETPEDLAVIAALSQDAVAQTSEMAWAKRKHRFTALLNRFRWEDRERAERMGRDFERVQTLLVVEGVLKVASQGIDPADRDLVLNLLSVDFEPGAEGSGRLVLTFSGDGAIALEVEALDVTLSDVSRPYRARAKSAPSHKLD